MSLRVKISLAIIGAVIAGVGVIFAISELTFIKGFRQIEDKNTVQMAQRAKSALSDKLNSLSILNHDWAAWDDTYNYVQKPSENQVYIQSNPTDTTFSSAGLNFIFILNSARQIVYAKGYDLDAQQQVPIPDSLPELFAGDTFTLHEQLDDKVSGIILLPQAPLLVSALPIVTSNGEGPIAGTIIMAQYMDSKVVGILSDTIHLPLEFYNVDEPNIPPDFQSAFSALSAKTPEISLPTSAQSIAGYALVDDIYGKPALVFRVELPRDIYSTGMDTMRYFFFSLLVLAVICGILFRSMLGKLVISRVKEVGDYASRITSSGDLTTRLLIQGNDELSQLGKSINSMVGALQESQVSLRMQKASEEKLRLTIESVAEGLATTDLEGKITDANDSKVSLHGFSRKEELIGKSSLDLIAAADRDKALRALKTTLETGRSGTSEYAMLRTDGTRFFGERSAALLKDPLGKAVGFVIGTKNVSERKKAEETLKASEAKFRNLVENAAVGIMITLADGRVLSANKAALQIFGYSSKEELSDRSTLARYVDPQDRKRLLEFVDLMGVAKGFEVRMRRKDGGSFWASLNVITQVSQSGERQLISIVEDITERKTAEDELSRLNQELKSFNSRLAAKVEERTQQLEEAVNLANESNRAKSEFLASMSHELRTPLNAIIGFSQVLHEQYFGALNEKQTEYMSDILESGKHLLALINDILDLSKVEAGKMELEKTPVKIKNIVNNSLVMIKEKAQVHRINLEIEIDKSLDNLEIMADERRLKQVIFNLLSNSAKFTPDGGTIRVEGKEAGGEVVISVSDTGIGITPEEQKKLFTAFYQASGGLKDKTPGTGLGLSITRSIVEKHGGRIWLESEGRDKGSRFSFTLPVAVVVSSARN